eukprot:Opistho-1_new@62707
MHGQRTDSPPAAIHGNGEAGISVKDKPVDRVHADGCQPGERKAGDDRPHDARHRAHRRLGKGAEGPTMHRHCERGECEGAVHADEHERTEARAGQIVREEVRAHLVISHRIVRRRGEGRRKLLHKRARECERVGAVLLQRAGRHRQAVVAGERVEARVVPRAAVKVHCVDAAERVRAGGVCIRAAVVHVHVVVGRLRVEARDHVPGGAAGRVRCARVHVREPPAALPKAVENGAPAVSRALLVEEAPDGRAPRVAGDDVMRADAVLFRHKRKDDRVAPGKRGRLRKRAKHLNVVCATLAGVKRGGTPRYRVAVTAHKQRIRPRCVIVPFADAREQRGRARKRRRHPGGLVIPKRVRRPMHLNLDEKGRVRPCLHFQQTVPEISDRVAVVCVRGRVACANLHDEVPEGLERPHF